MIKEFKAFIMRGNAVDLAVGVVMAAAFGAVVNSIVKNLLTPLTTIWQSCTQKQIDEDKCSQFAELAFSVRGRTFGYGAVLNDILTLILIGAAVFFLVVRPLNHLEERRRRESEPDSPTRPCPECLSDIPKLA